MYEPITQSLNEIMMFAILGFFLAALYEPLRIIRLFIKTGAIAAGVQDFLFLSASGLITFAYAAEFGSGYFRYFHLIGTAFGAAVYFLTAGKLISFIMKTFSNAIKAALRYAANVVKRVIVLPLRNLLVYIAQKISALFVNFHEFSKKRCEVLKNKAKIRYNNIQAKKIQAKKQSNLNIRENQNGITKRTAPAIKARVVKSSQEP